MTICLFFLVLALSQTPESQPASTPSHRLIAAADGEQIPESSGVVPSRVNPGLFWTHNDSGDGPFVYAFRLTARDRAARTAHVMGAVTLIGAENKDWEDIAWGPGGVIYLFDGGDNPPCKRDHKRVYRFVEPKIDLSGPALALKLTCESMKFEYPSSANADQPATQAEDRYDAECFFVHPISGDFYVVTKRNTKNVPVARVYRFPGKLIRWNQPEAVHVLKFVTDLTPKVRSLLDAATMVNAITGGDIDDTGRRVVLRDYLKAIEFALPPEQPFEKIFDQTPVMTSLAGEPQGEGICYSLDGRELLMTSEMERMKSKRMPVFAAPSATAPALTSSPARLHAAER